MTEKINITDNKIEIEDDGITVHFDFFVPIDPNKVDTYIFELREQIKERKILKTTIPPITE